MKLNEFKSLLNNSSPPAGISDLLLALWYDSKGDWHKAHEAAQRINDNNGAWIHAYLHRKEGDESNARYWYSRAGRNFSEEPLEKEWETIVSEILKIQSKIV